jgi:hypothetical protein
MGSFADILTREFRWPKKGDQPFSVSGNWQQNARVVTGVHSRLVIMMGGYKAAADLLVERSQRSGFDRDTLVYPIVFTYRQFIELELKYLIATYGFTVGVKANWKSHDIAFLWSEFAKVLAGYGAEDPDQTHSVVSAIVAEFAKVDPDSYSYRYPVDTQGNEIPLAFEALDLVALKDVMDGVGVFFTGCDGYLDHLQGAGP